MIAELEGKEAATAVREPGEPVKRKMNAAARARIRDAQKKRWAEFHKANGTTKPTKRRAKRQMSPEGRERIAEATRKRWAEFRAAKAAGANKAARKTTRKMARKTPAEPSLTAGATV